MSICNICKSICTEGQVLSNGNKIHTYCFQLLNTQYNQQYKEFKSAKESLDKVQLLLEEHISFMGGIRRFFGGSTKEHDTLRESEEKLVKQFNQNQKLFFDTFNTITAIWDFLPSYPPDWNNRTKKMLEGNLSCSKCTKRNQQLHVHHIIPLSRGGSNRYDNLEVLCESCHSKEHGGKTFSYKLTNEDNSFSVRLKLIEQAIREKKTISFLYAKYGETPTNRRASPRSINNYEHERKHGSTLCVEGFCYLRNEDRTFAISRMSKVKIDIK